MKKIRVAVFGAAGRMGRELAKIVQNSRNLELVGLVDQGMGKSFVALSDLHKRAPTVVVDFSSPAGTAEISKWCAEHKTALVSGTTGLTEMQRKEITTATKKIAFFYSPNMSLGVNAMAGAIKEFLSQYAECEITIEEIHHNQKRDIPSGTAQFLDHVVRSVGSKSNKIAPIISIRGGEIFGIHKVYFFSQGEWLCFEHQATGRSVFARGALKVAAWLAEKKTGLYSMPDFLKDMK